MLFAAKGEGGRDGNSVAVLLPPLATWRVTVEHSTRNQLQLGIARVGNKTLQSSLLKLTFGTLKSDLHETSGVNKLNCINIEISDFILIFL